MLFLRASGDLAHPLHSQGASSSSGTSSSAQEGQLVTISTAKHGVCGENCVAVAAGVFRGLGAQYKLGRAYQQYSKAAYHLT